MVVDEGSGAPIVFVHGNPSWSFEFRHLIRALRSDVRCIAPDHIGFGLSARSSLSDTPQTSFTGSDKPGGASRPPGIGVALEVHHGAVVGWGWTASRPFRSFNRSRITRDVRESFGDAARGSPGRFRSAVEHPVLVQYPHQAPLFVPAHADGGRPGAVHAGSHGPLPQRAAWTRRTPGQRRVRPIVEARDWLDSIWKEPAALQARWLILLARCKDPASAPQEELDRWCAPPCRPYVVAPRGVTEGARGDSRAPSSEVAELPGAAGAGVGPDGGRLLEGCRRLADGADSLTRAMKGAGRRW